MIKSLMRHRAGLGLLVAGIGFALGMAGCAETAIVGSILNEDVEEDVGLLLNLTRGSNSEVEDIFGVGNGYKWVVLSASDDLLNDGTTAAEERFSTGTWDRSSVEDIWEQGGEGIWAGLKVVNNAMGVLSEEEFTTSPLVARGYLNAAHSERIMGDAFCQLAYGFDHTGGPELQNLGSSTFDAGPVGKDSTYKRMATFAELAVAQAERAVAAGVENPVNEGVLSDGHFDPERLRFASHAAAAQAYHALASLGVEPEVNWDLAVQHALEVPTDFVEVVIHQQGVAELNQLWNISWNNDDVTLWSAPDDTRPEGFIGTPATFFWGDDPRVDVQDCTVDPTGCNDNFGGVSEGEEFPLWVPLKYPDNSADHEMVTGTEALLIQAEEALVRRQDLGTFYDLVDEVRAFHGASPTERPMVVGDFEWPNAQDDAMSILDRERYLTMWLEGRRLFDLHRWNHPFLTNNEALMPRIDELLAMGVTRGSCMPIAESECSLNPNVSSACS
ncbi:MAG: RagB/SusD family nutrient uptake outer membrane protein [Longimicrobiales bacterium]